jgi:hypothetical protein
MIQIRCPAFIGWFRWDGNQAELRQMQQALRQSEVFQIALGRN